MLRVGFDIGSVNINLVVVDKMGNILEDRYLRYMGNPIHKAAGLLEELQGAHGRQIEFVVTTGIDTKAFAAQICAQLGKIILDAETVSHSFRPA